MLRRAASADLPAIESLLAASELPTAGVAQHLQTTWVLVEKGTLVGCVGYEPCGPFGLLRSLAVAADHRGLGFGRTLLGAGVAEMRKPHLRQAFGLTTTIAPLLRRSGWKEIPRTALPPALMASHELQGSCPDSAVAFRLDLAT